MHSNYFYRQLNTLHMPTTDIYATPHPKLKNIDRLSELLDSRFRIPGTDIRFGVDFLIGLVPYGGDILSFMMSGALVLTMARHGASGGLVAKMLFNILLDTVVGAVPILGDIFDLFYKSNRRNYHLLREHYVEGKHDAGAKKVIIGTLIALVLLFILLLSLIVWVVGFTWGLLFG